MDIFIDKHQIENLLHSAYHSTSTLGLLQYFRSKRDNRQPFFINLTELEKILQWKLINQYGRQRAIRHQNTDANVVLITKAAFAVSHNDKSVELKLKMNLLRCLFGVEVPVASAILAICYPEEHSVIDFRNWRQLFPNHAKTFFTVHDYLSYMEIIRQLSSKYDFTPQQIDLALWQKDKEQFLRS